MNIVESGINPEELFFYGTIPSGAMPFHTGAVHLKRYSKKNLEPKETIDEHINFIKCPPIIWFSFYHRKEDSEWIEGCWIVDIEFDEKVCQRNLASSRGSLKYFGGFSVDRMKKFMQPLIDLVENSKDVPEHTLH